LQNINTQTGYFETAMTTISQYNFDCKFLFENLRMYLHFKVSTIAFIFKPLSSIYVFKYISVFYLISAQLTA